MLKYYAVGAALAIVGLLAGSAAYVWFGARGDQFAECRASQVAGGGDLIGGPFTLTRHDGVEVTETDVIDGLTLIYFGYTFCPDVCPFDVARNAEVADLLDARGVALTPVLVTVDPERDTPAVLADYGEFMHPRMVGLTGSDDQIEVAKTAYRAFGQRAQGEAGQGENYIVDHSTLSYLMAPEIGFLDFFRRDASAEDMANRIACFAERV